MLYAVLCELVLFQLALYSSAPLLPGRCLGVKKLSVSLVLG